MKEKEERFVVDGSSLDMGSSHLPMWCLVMGSSEAKGGRCWRCNPPPPSKKMCGLNSERMQRCDLVEVVHGGDGVEGDDRAVTDR